MTLMTLSLPSFKLLPVVLGLVLLPAILILHGTGSASRQPQVIKRHDKVGVVSGKSTGAIGVVVVVRRGKVGRRYKIRLGGGAVRLFRRSELVKQPLALGDAVKVLHGRQKGAVGKILRILPRSRVRRFVVALRRGRNGRFARNDLRFVPPRNLRRGTFAQPACAPGATNVVTVVDLRSAIAAGQNVCVTTSVGDVDLSGLSPPRTISVGTAGGSLGRVILADAARITLRARFLSAELRNTRSITIENSIVGGTRAHRIYDQLILISCCSDDVAILDSDIGWTTADGSGNTGYGLRVQGTVNRLTAQRNYFHHIGADAIQGFGDGVGSVIDRNEIAYVAPPATSSEHADDIQIIDHGRDLRITNNYLHHNGYLEAGVAARSESGPYIHAGDDDLMLFENNLIRDEGNFMQVGNLGTGGCQMSNLRFRRNTFFNNARAFNGVPDLMWRLCRGSNNVFERNLVIGDLANEFGFSASGTRVSHNLIRNVALDEESNCAAAACNPKGAEPIGYRKPTGVHW